MDLWSNLLSLISDKVDKSKLKLLSGVKSAVYKDGKLYISAPDKLYKEWLKNNFYDEIKYSASVLLGNKPDVQFVVEQEKLEDGENNLKEKENLQKIDREPYHLTNINPKYTFSNFAVGSSNKIAYTVCMSVADNIGKVYNPLFIYGGIGLGKTHLLHATANYILAKNRDANIIYTTADTFMSELVYFLQKGNILEFRKRYKNVDLLLIDDVQFLEGKERTQIELYHIFNALYLIGKQVILSSDTPPRNLTGIQERLKSRFSAGLVVEIKQPDLPTKLSIIGKKVKELDIVIPNDVKLLIAKTINTNVRELESSLLRLKAHSEILGKPITLELAREVLRDILDLNNIEELSLEKIQKEVSNYFSVNINEILGKSRKKKVVIARQIAMYLCRYLTDKSLNDISRAFKRKDHTTILKAIEKVEKNMEKNRKFKLTVEFLKERIMSM